MQASSSLLQQVRANLGRSRLHECGYCGPRFGQERDRRQRVWKIQVAGEHGRAGGRAEQEQEQEQGGQSRQRWCHRAHGIHSIALEMGVRALIAVRKRAGQAP